jgi:hypothetical protein
MSERVIVPVRVHNNQKWGWLSAICPDHDDVEGGNFQMFSFSFVHDWYQIFSDHHFCRWSLRKMFGQEVFLYEMKKARRSRTGAQLRLR